MHVRVSDLRVAFCLTWAVFTFFFGLLLLVMDMFGHVGQTWLIYIHTSAVWALSLLPAAGCSCMTLLVVGMAVLWLQVDGGIHPRNEILY